MNWLAGRQRNQDALLALVVAIAAIVILTVESNRTASVWSYAAVTVAATALFWRRRWPIPVLVAVVVARVAVTWQAGSEHALMPAAMLAFYTVARAGNRRTHIPVAIAVSFTMATAVGLLVEDPFVAEALGDIALMLLPLALGDAGRARAEHVESLIDTEADRRVAAERLRIARDLHDVVAHGLSTIAIQSGVAAHLIDRDPQQAKDALETINSTGKSALEELRAMVGVLRSTDDVPLRPTPTDPDNLTELIAGAADAGLDVTVSTTGQFPASAGESCVVAVHRITQEALTNVARHAGAVAVDVEVAHGETAVLLVITNAPGTASQVSRVPSTGVGVIGMIERAEALGGTLTTGATDDGRFRVSAMIPYHHRRDDRERP